MKKIVVVGSGAGGAVAAEELQGFAEVTVLEKGGPFRPFRGDLDLLAHLRKTGLFLDERLISLLMPAMRIGKTDDGVVLVNGEAVGGSTTLSAGNAMRADRALREIGIDLDREFEELAAEVPITDAHRGKWREATNSLFSICQELGLDPSPTPKMGKYEQCTNCGRCVLGCPYGVKWDSRAFLNEAVRNGAQLVTGCRVESVHIERGSVRGVWCRQGLRRRFYPADIVILAAGGLGTPVILERSGISCEPSLFVDPVLCIAAPFRECAQNRELTMPFVVRRERYIISPYFDHLSFLFNREWKHSARNTLGIMIKLADSPHGKISRKGAAKSLTGEDHQYLTEATELCCRIFERLGIRRERLLRGTINAGHPGGMLPLTPKDAESLHPGRLPAHLYVADASLFPDSLGLPPILTIMALAKRVSRKCKEML